MDQQRAGKPPARIVLGGRQELVLLAVTLWAWFVIAAFVDLTCHEAAHALVAAALGKPVHGIYISAVEGYAFSIEGGIGESWVRSLDTAAGVPAGMLLGLAAALILRRGMGRYGVGASAFLLWLACLGLTQEPAYLALGWLPRMVPGGDVQYLIRMFGIHPLWFAVPGTVLVVVGGVTSGLLLKRWLATYVPGMTKRQSWALPGMVVLLLVVAGTIASALQRSGRWV